MGGLFGGGGTTISTSDPLIGAIRIQTSVYGQPVPIVLGRTRVTANLIWYGDFQAIPHTTTTSSGGGGGKGGGGEVTSSNTTYTYQAAVAMNLCEGPVSAIGAVWAGKDQTDMAKLGMTLYSGALSQSAWGYLTTKHPDEALAYPGSAYVAGGAYQLNSSAGLPNHSFEVSGPLAFSGSIPDANPKDIVSQFLGNAQWGSGFPAAMVGDLTPFSNYCVANSIFLSPAIIEQRQAHEYLTEWVRLCNSEVVWSEGKLKIVPYGDQAATGNGATFTPNVTPIYDLTDDDFLPTGGDPVTVTRKTVADAFNTVQVEFINRANQYNIEIAEAKDQSDIELRGLRPAEPLKAHAIADPAVARFVAQKEVQRYQQVRNEYEFKLGWKYCLLEPMDIVTLTDAGLGMYQFSVRIIELEEDETGALTVRAEEFPSGVATASLYPVEIVGGYVLNNNVAPGAVNDPVIFEPPNVMTAPNLEVWIGASGGVNWGGCEVWVSEDNASYRKIGNITNPARHGVLSASLASGSDPDTTHTLAVDLTVSGGVLTSGTQADADNGNTLMWVDGELIAYQTAALTSAYHYSLTYLRRGQRGSNIGAHNAGAKFARLDGAIFRYLVPREMIGRPVWLKFASVNLFGNALQSLAECTAYNYTIAGNRPAGLASLSATGGMFLNQLGWTFAANQYDRDYTEIWGSTTNDRATALPLTSAKSPTAAWKHPGLQPAQTWYYWGRVVDTSGNESDFYPASATAGVSATPSSDPSALLTQLQKSLGTAQLAESLAAPIALVIDPANLAAPGSLALSQAQAAAEAALNVLLKADELKKRAQVEKWVTDATATIDPATGKVTLLATAALSTDVEAHLNQVDLSLGAMDGSIQSHTSTLNAYGGRISTAETNITQMQGDIALKASSSYVDASVAGALGAIDPANVAAAAQSGAEGLLQALLDGDASRRKALSAAVRLATAESTLSTHADALVAEAIARLVLAAQVENAAAAIVSEQIARASADSAQASSLTTLLARLDSGDYAAVKIQASASASALAGVLAKYLLQVDANGHVAGMQLASGAGGSSVTWLADKLLFAMPDGSGTPRQVFIVGDINGSPTLGFDGNAIIDGSIVARSLAVEYLSAIAANLGTVTAGRLQNAGNTNFLNLDAVGATAFLKVSDKVTINADGSAVFSDVVISRQMVVSSGTYNVGNLSTSYTEEYAELAHWDIDTTEPLSAWAGANATYIANAGVFGTVTTYTGVPPDVYWGVVCQVLPLTVWSGSQVVRMRLSLWGKHVLSVANFGINWKLYKVT